MTWIWFLEDKVWNFFRRHGEVYTVRKADRPEGIAYTRRPGGKPIRVEVSLIQTLHDTTELRRFVEWSGFKDIEEWVEAIDRQHANLPIESLALFHVKVLPP
jgi:hypothetical protein